MFVPRTNSINTIRRWSLIAAIGIIALVNVAVTSQLTRDSLAETPFDLSTGSVNATIANETQLADLNPKYFETVEVVEGPVTHDNASSEEAGISSSPTIKRHKVYRIRPKFAERTSLRKPAKFFEPIVITYAGPASKSLTANGESYPVRRADDPVAQFERTKPHQKDPFALRMIKKPYDWLKMVASKLR